MVLEPTSPLPVARSASRGMPKRSGAKFAVLASRPGVARSGGGFPAEAQRGGVGWGVRVVWQWRVAGGTWECSRRLAVVVHAEGWRARSGGGFPQGRRGAEGNKDVTAPEEIPLLRASDVVPFDVASSDVPIRTDGNRRWACGWGQVGE